MSSSKNRIIELNVEIDLLNRELETYQRQIVVLKEQLNIAAEREDIYRLKMNTEITKLLTIVDQFHDFKKKMESNYNCIICLDNYRNCILEPCMHFSCCIKCVSSLPSNSCPICRTECNYYTKIYTT